MKQRLDVDMVKRGLVSTRSQAENFIRLQHVTVNGRLVSKAGTMVASEDVVRLTATEQYVSRAGLKLASVATTLGVSFAGAVVLDVGSSTGGFTDYALQHGATRVVAVDIGTDQLHPRLRGHANIELHEKTDIRDYAAGWTASPPATRPTFNVVVMDVSFISLREILPSVSRMCNSSTEVITMVKPQFEAGRAQVNKGIIKNDTIRRTILKDFEMWTQRLFKIVNKADSQVAGAKGNRERFYRLRILQK